MSLSKEQYEKDAAVLRKAMEGWGTDEGPIIEITAKRSNADRQQILKYYKTAYGRDAIKDLEDELGGNLQKVVLAMYRTPVDYDCMELMRAMKGMGTNEDTLIEIICTRSKQRMEEIKTRFVELYKETLEHWLLDELSGDIKRFLVALIQGGRSDTTNIDKAKLDKDVSDLYNAGENKLGTDEEAFIKLFSLRSPAELRYINQAYYKHTGKDLFQTIDDEFSGDIKKALKATLHAIIDPTDYFAERIKYACKGMGTNDDILIRVLVTRDEVDLKQIKEIYVKKFGLTLYQEIKDETSGDYKNMLLQIAMTD